MTRIAEYHTAELLKLNVKNVISYFILAMNQ